MALTPRQKKARRLWKMRALGLGYDEGGGGGVSTESIQAMFGGGEEGGIWDFTDAANLATATDGTGAVSNGSAIAYCADLSGNGHHLLQSTAASRPTWNVLGFASFVTNDYLTVSWPSTAQPITRASRFKPNSWGSNDFWYTGNGDGSDFYLYQAGTTPNYVMFAGNVSSGVAIPLTQWHSVIEFANSTSSTLTVDGSSTTGLNVGTGTIGGLTIGAFHSGTNPVINTDCSRLMMIDRALTAGELATVTAWLESVI